jgi:hypothetical protein
MGEDFANLIKLRDLYCRADPPVICQPSTRSSKTAQKKCGRGRSPGSEQPERKRVTRSSGLLGGSSKEASAARSGGKPVGESSFTISSATENWVLGPSVSYSDAIKRFAYLIESPSF